MSFWDKFKTGDLCINRTHGKFASFIRGISISEYNHASIAIRIDEKYLPKLKIVRTGGTLLFMEKDRFPDTNELGRNLRTHFMEHIKILRFPLKNKLYTDEFKNRLEIFLHHKAVNVEIIKGQKILIHKDKDLDTQIFKYSRLQPIPKIETVCSELSADFYSVVFHDKIDKNITPALVFSPQTFLTSNGNPYHNLFNAPEVVFDISNNQNDTSWLELLYIIIFIILIILLVYYIYKYFKLYY